MSNWCLYISDVQPRVNHSPVRVIKPTFAISTFKNIPSHTIKVYPKYFH